MFTIIIATIGSPFLNEALKTMENFPPAELIIVLDVLGRETSNLDTIYPLAQLEADLAKSPCKPKLLYYKPEPSQWGVMNGCYNFGAKEAKYDYIMFTHDDILFDNSYDYHTAIGKVLKNIEADNRVILGKDIRGICIPEYEILNKVIVPMNGNESGSGKDWCLCQVYSPVSHILHKSCLADIGGFDEEFGIWYDGQMQIESFQRNWWYIHLPTPLLQHESVKTYRMNNWGERWKNNPKWLYYPDNFRRKYNTEWERNLSLSDGIVLTDSRFGL